MKHFSIPNKGLKDGSHSFRFDVEENFFRHFGNEEMQQCKIIVLLDLEKQPGVDTLVFEIDGNAVFPCDRCLVEIDIPIKGNYNILMKLGEEEDSNEEVMYIHPETSILSLAQLIYEYIILSVPIIKNIECEEMTPPPCDMDILDKIETVNENNDTENPLWNPLKGIEFDNN